ncbi:MAG: fimbrillin family protein [Rikenellaceae bacterium]|nr:fimbrillin family protein [Rikenellaceae bacterium]
MKKLIYICAAAVLAFSCNSDNAESGGGGTPGDGAAGSALTLSVSVDDRADGSVSRAVGDEFFGSGYEIDVHLETSYNTATQSFVYTYQGNNIFSSTSPFYFATDDTYITELTAIWPRQSVRDQGLLTDQREFENFRLADWLTAEATSLNVMPTDAAVPLNFERDNVLVEFEIAGQNAEGIDIKELIIEIEVEDTPTAFWAYCGDENGHAQILLDKTTSLRSDESYLIGRMKVTDNYEYTIIFPAVDIDLVPGHRYLVTLTAQGYDIDAYVFIGGWVQPGEYGIGIPFAPPEPTEDDDFIISQPYQLISMSYLIRHYPNPDTFVWTERTYVVSDSLIMPDDLAEQYIPIPRGDFNGSIVDESGYPIETVPTASGQLALYED